jgi:hypothetical protein
LEDCHPTSIPAADFDVKRSNAEETPGIFGEMRSETRPAVISINGMSVNRSTPVEFDQHDNKSTAIMKLKLNATLATVGFTIATLAITACGISGDGSHNMGDNRNYKPMPNQDMPARQSSDGNTGGSSSNGTHNMGTNRVYEPMPNREMPYRN